MSEGYCVGLDVTVIADGIDGDADGGPCNVSLRLAPRPEPNGPVDLMNWPAEVAKLRFELTGTCPVWDDRGTISSLREPKPWVSTPATGLPAATASRANAEWAQVFGRSRRDYERLMAELYPPASASFTPSPKDPPELRYFSERQLARLLDAVTGRSIAEHLAARVSKAARPLGLLPPDPRDDWSRGLPLTLWQALAGERPAWSPAPVDVEKLSPAPAAHEVDRRHQALGAIASRLAGPPGRSSLLDESDALATELSHVRSALRMDVPGSDAERGPEKATNGGDPPSWDSPDVVRKLSDILAHPALAKYFGFIVDLTVDRATMTTLLQPARNRRQYGVLAARAVHTPDHAKGDPALHWSAAVLGTSPLDGKAYFGPCTRGELQRMYPDQGVDEIIDGVVNLSLKMPSGEPRFTLHAEDIVQSTQVLTSEASAIAGGQREGRLPGDQSLRPTERKGGGLVLLDGLLTLRNHEENERAATPAANLNEGLPVVSFATELLQGYRADVALLKSDATVDGWGSCDRWRSLVGRKLSFPGHLADGLVTERDDGMVGTPAGSWGPEEKDAKRTTITDDRVFTWRGEALGVPSLQHDERVNVEDAGCRSMPVFSEHSLAIDMVYDLPKSDDRTGRRPPPLREGRSYMIGLRACFVNGCGPGFAEGVRRYVGAHSRPFSPVLGTDSRHAFRFIRQTEVQAPEVLLPFDHPLVAARYPAEETPGENVDTLVVRSGSLRTSRTRRMLVPARAPFEVAEQAGVFDRQRDAAVPTGAFEGAVRISRGKRTGSFPLARDGRWEFFEAEADPGPGCLPPTATAPPEEGTKTPARGNRGPVLALDPLAAIPDDRYHVDPHAGSVGARFVRGNDPAMRYDAAAPRAQFWTDESRNAVPVILELRRGRAPAPSGNLGRFRDDSRGVADQLHGSAIWLPMISVELAPAEEVELELWPIVDTESIPDRHAALATGLATLDRWLDTLGLRQMGARFLGAEATRAITDIAEMVRLSAPGRARLQEILALGPVPQLCSRRRVRLVHAVDRPLRKPVVVASGAHRGVAATDGPQLVAVVLSPRAEEEVAGDRTADQGLTGEGQRWSDYAQSHGALPLFEWASVPDGTTTFFAGEILLHRPSTGKLRARATWDEYEPAGRREEKGRWHFHPRSIPSTQLFQVDRIAMTDELRDVPFSLVLNDDPTDTSRRYRGLSYSFTDSKARRLLVDFVATSRFTEYFPPETPKEREAAQRSGVGKYEVHSLEPVEVWVPSTVRPDAPRVDRIIPVFHWNRHEPFFGEKITWRRDTVLRIYLAGDWFSSGEGEQLAVVFGPSRTDLCAYEAEVRELGQFLTRWGTDPIHESFALPPLMDPSNVKAPPGETDGVVRDLRHAVGSPGAEITEVLTPCRDGEQLTPRNPVTVRGTGLATDTPVRVNGVEARIARVLPHGLAEVELGGVTTCPLDIRVDHGLASVTIKAFTPKLDEQEGLWYCDLHIDALDAYYPFVQLGLARYQEHSAPGVELSPLVAAWTQVPPIRCGSVEFGGSRTILVTHEGTGYANTALSGEQLVDDAPRLNLRLLRASTSGRVPGREDHSPSWAPVLDDSRCPVQRLLLPPFAGEQGMVRWKEPIPLPPPTPGVRYGLLIEEVEVMEADPDPLEFPNAYSEGPDQTLLVKTMQVERGPMFGHIVDLGE